MTENDVLYRLAGQVGALEAKIEGLTESQGVAWGTINDIRRTTNEMDKKLDKLVAHDERITKTEEGVNDYLNTKTRIVAWIAGLGLGAGSIGGFFGGIISKVFGGNS